jgi:hypothetical protein
MMTNGELAERVGGIDDSAVAKGSGLAKRIQNDPRLSQVSGILQEKIDRMS